MEWFSKLPSNIKTFDQLASMFISQYSYNIKKEVIMIDLCNTKKLSSESFKVFLQRWRHTFAKYHKDIPEKEKTYIFINSLSKPMNYSLQLQGYKDFKTTLENASKVEETLINNDIIKLSKDGKAFSNNSTKTHNSSDQTTDKQKSWWKNNNKNVVNDGMVKANHVKPQTQPPLNQPHPTINNNNPNTPQQDNTHPLYRHNATNPSTSN